MSEAADPVLAAIGDLIGAIGAPDFGERFLALLRELGGTEYCSAFAFDGARPRVLFAAGEHPAIRNFAQVASIDYARGYWRRDTVGRAMIATRREGVTVTRVAAVDIRDLEHRHNCYDRAGIGSRISLCRFGRPGILANGYRAAASGPYSLADVERVERHATILSAAVARHVAAVDAIGPAWSRPALVRLLLEMEPGLSAREIDVAAAIALGRTGPEIAAETGLALSSVVTYRRRAYQKLGVTDRRGLSVMLRKLRDGA